MPPRLFVPLIVDDIETVVTSIVRGNPASATTPTTTPNTATGIRQPHPPAIIRLGAVARLFDSAPAQCRPCHQSRIGDGTVRAMRHYQLLPPPSSLSHPFNDRSHQKNHLSLLIPHPHSRQSAGRVGQASVPTPATCSTHVCISARPAVHHQHAVRVVS